ncbi:MAG: insulinase family protein [Waddliaceae bacterium]
MHSFKTINQKYIEEINCTLFELVHETTGAVVMHIAKDDKENLFSLSFPTYLNSSNGVAHILEHTILCGSKKYPVKDPFFGMKRRSLNTFMNAFTGSDFTCYPASSQIKKDFYNLLEVYLDAVFHPNLTELSFRQEGHRLEFQDPEDPSSPLMIQGIVYNEMKGALSSSEARLGDKINAMLFPDLTYHYTLGGDPKEIPTLTHRQLIDFHKEYYHPSRCLFFFYGDLPLDDHLQFLEEKVLNQKWEKKPPLTLPKQTRLKEPQEWEGSYPFSGEDTEEHVMHAFSWLTCEIQDQEMLLAISVLSSVLLETDASLLKRRLIESKLAKQIIVDLESDFSEVPIIILCKGCRAESKKPLEELIEKTLRSIIKEGVPTRLVEHAIHQIEFHRSEITGDHYPYGLSLFMRAGLIKQHNGKAENALKIHMLCDQLREKIEKDPNYLGSLIEKYFLNNPHQAKVTMHPDTTLGEKESKEERERINSIAKNLTDEQKKSIVQQAKELKAYQESEDDEEVLPTITLSDVPEEYVNYPLNKKDLGDWTLYHHDAFTNDILYADIVFNLPPIEKSDIPYLRLFQRLLTEVGCGDRDYLTNLEYLQAHTGGITASLSLNYQIDAIGEIQPTFSLFGKALSRETAQLFSLFKDILTSPRFDETQRIRDIILKQHTSLQSHLAQKGLSYAIQLSTKSFGVGREISSLLFGIDYLHFLRDLVDNIDEKLPKIQEKLFELKNKLLLTGSPDIVLTCDHSLLAKIESNQFYGLNALPLTPSTRWDVKRSTDVVASQGRIISSPVSFTAMSMPSITYTDPDAPALTVAHQLFDTLHLHRAIREQGGAYGAGASFNPISNNLTFWSYRDPNVKRTLEAFKKAVVKVANGEFDEEDLIQSKLEIFQDLDNPISPGSRGHAAYFLMREGRTEKVRHAYRKKILSATKEQIIKAVQTHILPAMESATVVTFGGKELLESENIAFAAAGMDQLPLFPA